MIFFRPWHEYFLGKLGCMNFFSFNIPLREFFFVLRPQEARVFFQPALAFKMKNQSQESVSAQFPATVSII